MYQDKNHKAYLQLNSGPLEKEIDEFIEIANRIIEAILDYLTMFKKILGTRLPLKPYKDWLTREDKQAKHTIKTLKETIEATGLKFNNKLLGYDDYKAEITDEDIEDFKRAGLI